MKPNWTDKRDLEKHPVRFLAGVWQKQMGTQLTARELGQLKLLREELGEFTRPVIDWMLDSVN